MLLLLLALLLSLVFLGGPRSTYGNLILSQVDCLARPLACSAFFGYDVSSHSLKIGARVPPPINSGHGKQESVDDLILWLPSVVSTTR